MSLLCSSCLDAPPEFEAATRTAPVILWDQVVPPLTETTTRRAQVLGFDPVEFRVPFRSEDLGEGLWAVFILDYRPGDPDPNVVGLVTASPSDVPFDEQESRQIAFDWTPEIPGCHTITLLFAHQSNIRFSGTPEIQDTRLAAAATWWFNLEDEEGNDNLVSDCPSNQPTRPQ